MANSYNSGSMFIDATGAITTQRVRVVYVVLTTVNAGDVITLRDGDGAGDPVKLYLKGVTAASSIQFDFSNAPIVFQDGVYCSEVTSGASAMLITTSEGAS